MVKNSFLEIVVISTLSLMRRAWIITVTCYSLAGYIPGLPLTGPPVAGHFKLCVRMRHLRDVDCAASKYDACFNNLSHSDEKPANQLQRRNDRTRGSSGLSCLRHVQTRGPGLPQAGVVLDCRMPV